MEFRRRGTRSFVSSDGEFRIRRPAGPGLKRGGLNVTSPDHEYEILIEGTEVWLVDGDREIGYANGSQNNWTVILGERLLELDQPKLGVPHTFVSSGEQRIGQFAGSGFPLRAFCSEGELVLSDEQTAFVAAIVLTGWRESDRGMLAAGTTSTD